MSIKNKYFTIPDKYILLLIFISALFLVSMVHYASKTYKIPEWDEQHYMQMATGFYRLLKHPTVSTPYEMLQIVPFRQPGYPLSIQPFLLFFGISHYYFWGLFTNGLYYVASFFGIYFISKSYLTKRSSFLAAIFFSCYGWPLLHVHLAYSETAVSALTIWSIVFLIKSNLFQNRKYSLLFGLFLGLGLLTKWIIVIYVAGFLLYEFYQIKKIRLINKNVIINITLSLLVTFVVAFYPYVANAQWMFSYFYEHRSGGAMWQIVPEYETNPLSVYSLTFYLNTFAQLGIVQFALFIAGFLLALRKSSKLKGITLVIIFGYVFSCFALLKGDRYIIPIFPYLAILSGSVFDQIKNIRYKTLLILICLAFSFFTFLGTVWGKGPMKHGFYALPPHLPFGQWDRIYITTVSRPPYIYKISGKEILDYIDQDSKVSKIKDPQVLSLFYYHSLDEPLMTYNLYNRENPFQITNFIGTTITNPEKDAQYIAETIKNSDYVLTKTGIRTDSNFSKENYTTLKALILLFDNYFKISDYYEAKETIWIYQDSSEVTIFKKKRELSHVELEEMRLKLMEILMSKPN